MLEVMSVTPETPKSSLMDWLKESGLLTVTILGLLLYTLFAIPTTIFYGILGTSPAEVGISYTGLLSGSALGFAVILFLLVYFGYLFVALGFSIRLRRAANSVSTVKNPHPNKRDRNLDDQDFETRMAWRAAFYARYPEIGESLKQTWKDLEPKLRVRRNLQRTDKLTPEQLLELKSTKRQIARYTSRAQRDAIMGWLRRHPIWLCSIYFAVLLILSLIAAYNATDVYDGLSYDPALGLFGYRAEQVSVCPATKADAQMYKWLFDRQVYLLGETAQSAILFLPSDGNTVHVPISAVIISSTQC
jgi:hypothetical protein